jgi:putative copper export protein
VLAVAKLLLYTGVAILVGAVALRRWRAFDVAGTTQGTLRTTLAAAWCSVFVALVAMLALQARDLELESWSALSPLVAGTTWGRGWLVLVICAVAGALAFVRRWSDGFQSLIAVVLAFALGGLGHAAADQGWPLLARFLDGVHVLGVGGWIGGLFLLARFAPHEHQRDAWATFSRGATLLAPVVVITGVAASLLRLRASSLADGLSSGYGRLLLAKSAIVLVVIGFGLLHRRHLSRSAVPGKASVRAELSFAVLVLLVTGFLTGTSPPGE